MRPLTSTAVRAPRHFPRAEFRGGRIQDPPRPAGDGGSKIPPIAQPTAPYGLMGSSSVSSRVRQGGENRDYASSNDPGVPISFELHELEEAQRKIDAARVLLEMSRKREHSRKEESDARGPRPVVPEEEPPSAPSGIQPKRATIAASAASSSVFMPVEPPTILKSSYPSAPCEAFAPPVSTVRWGLGDKLPGVVPAMPGLGYKQIPYQGLGSVIPAPGAVGSVAAMLPPAPRAIRSGAAMLPPAPKTLARIMQRPCLRWLRHHPHYCPGRSLRYVHQRDNCMTPGVGILEQVLSRSLKDGCLPQSLRHPMGCNFRTPPCPILIMWLRPLI